MPIDFDNLTPEQKLELEQVHGIVSRVYANPKGKEKLEAAVREVIGNENIDPFLKDRDDKIEKLAKELDGIKGSAKAWQHKQEVEQLKAAGYQDEGLAKVEEIAKEKNLSLADAAMIFEGRNPPQRVNPSGYQPAQIDDLKSALSDEQSQKDLWANPNQWFETNAPKIYNKLN